MRFSLPTCLGLCACLAVLALVACGPDQIAQFWRPINEPNIEMPLAKAQRKLEFDLSQCHCGIYPSNVPHDEANDFQRDKQRLVTTGITDTGTTSGTCIQQPSLVVTECMRQRGWETTNCSGRMPLPGGGSLCTAFVPN